MSVHAQIGTSWCARIVWNSVVQVEVRGAGHRVVGIGAMGGPRRHEEQVRRQRPRVRGREHVVLQDELLRVPPVVRDLLRRVVAHDVRLTLRPEVPGALRIRAVIGAVQRAVDHGPDEPVHLPAVDVEHRVPLAVRPPSWSCSVVWYGPDALSRDRVGDAYRRFPVRASGCRRRPGTSRSSDRTNGSPGR